MRNKKLNNEDKSIYIAGTMALALFTFLTLCGVFIAQALGVGVIAAVVTYVFFDTCYYAKKTECYANSKQSETLKIICT